MKTKNNISEKTKKMVLLSFLAALVVVLQMFCQFVLQAHSLPISLVLLPIVVGGIILGPGAGAFLGFVFGLVVFCCSVTGLDKAGFILVSSGASGPYLTALVCIAKGALAGFLSSLSYRLMSKICSSKPVSYITAAAVTPIVNTALFVAGLSIFFTDTLYAWAGETNVAKYVIISLVGINFLIEFFINVIITPIIMPSIEKSFKS